MPGKDSTPTTYRLGEFTLNAARAELTGPRGRVPLRPQSFAVLLLLVANAGRLVPKEEIYAKIWANRAVTDDSLTQCLIDIRKALGDRDRKIIRTVPRRGFICVGDQATLTAADNARHRKFGPAALAMGLLLLVSVFVYLASDRSADGPVPIGNSVAVMPFVDLSPYGVEQYLGDGLAADILISLGQYPELRVIARTSTFAQSARVADIAGIRDALNVSYILEGSVRRTGVNVRILANLVDSNDGTRVWSESYDASQKDIFMIQQVIAAAVAEAILPGGESTASSIDPAVLSDADLIWLAGRYEAEVRAQQEVDVARLDYAVKLYRDAIAANPASALAHSRLASALLYGGDFASAEFHVLEALKLDPNLSEVQQSLGRYYWISNRLEAAGEAWKRAIALNPSNVDALSAYASWHFISKDVKETGAPEELYRRALELDPLNISRYEDLGFYLGSQSDVRATEELIQRIKDRFESAEAYLLISELLDFAGRIDESFQWIMRARELEPENSLHTEALAELYVDIGDVDRAMSIQPDPGPGILLKLRRYRQFIDEAQRILVDVPEDVHLRYLLAFAYNVTGQPREAIRIFESLGILDNPTGPSRQIVDVEARVVLADALRASGQLRRARDLASWWADDLFLDGRDWFRHLFLACSYAIAGRDEDALANLERVPDSARLPWMYILRDSPCFARFAGEPRYRAVIEQMEKRMTALRRRVAENLPMPGVTAQAQ